MKGWIPTCWRKLANETNYRIFMFSFRSNCSVLFCG